MLQCPVCGSIAPALASTCSTCGAPLADTLTPGTLLDGGNYLIDIVLGRGGFGITYRGTDRRLNRLVAIKELFPAGSMRRGATVSPPTTLPRADYDLGIQRFQEEARMLARFRHRSIVNVYEVFRENGTAYMAMEYLEGENLIERMERRNAPLSEAELEAITGPISEALDEVHAAGILHRDIKPQNIMLIGPQDAPRPVLIDFGAAREFVVGKTVSHTTLYTPGYTPLEQYLSSARLGPPTDIYALAATLYHVATGEQPLGAVDRSNADALNSPGALNKSLSAGFATAIMRGMAMKMDERHQGALEFHRELAARATAANPTIPPQLITPAPIPSPPSPPKPTPVPPPPPPPPKRRWSKGIAAFLFLAIVARYFGGVVTGQGNRFADGGWGESAVQWVTSQTNRAVAWGKGLNAPPPPDPTTDTVGEFGCGRMAHLSDREARQEIRHVATAATHQPRSRGYGPRRPSRLSEGQRANEDAR